jgi:hypothetical protein
VDASHQSSVLERELGEKASRVSKTKCALWEIPVVEHFRDHFGKCMYLWVAESLWTRRGLSPHLEGYDCADPGPLPSCKCHDNVTSSICKLSGLEQPLISSVNSNGPTKQELNSHDKLEPSVRSSAVMVIRSPTPNPGHSKYSREEARKKMNL